MEYLHNSFALEAPEGSFPLSTDSMLLADFVKLPRNASVLDLGSGCGTLGVLLCAREKTCTVAGVELTEDAHKAALENIRRNGLEGRLQSFFGDLRQYQGGPFDISLSNPPYFAGGPASRDHPLARREDFCTPEELFASAAKNLKYGGDFFLVHKPERMAQLMACGAKAGLEAKRLRLIKHKTCGEISLILLSFRKGGKPGLIIEEAALFDQNNQPTDYYKSVYHIND